MSNLLENPINTFVIGCIVGITLNNTNMLSLILGCSIGIIISKIGAENIIEIVEKIKNNTEKNDKFFNLYFWKK